MGIHIDGRAIGEVYHGSDQIREVYHGADLVWSAQPRTRTDWGLDRARDQALRIMFIGSSTVQGHGVAWSEGMTYQLTAHLASHLPGVEATPMIKATSGNRSAVTASGFHFLNAGVGGTNANNYYGPDRQGLVESFQPHIVVHMVGSNDYSSQHPLSDYRRDIVDVGNNIVRTGLSGVTQQLFIHAPRREDVDDAAVSLTWADYRDTLEDAVGDITRAEFLDLSDAFSAARATRDDLIDSDQVHLTEQGNTLVADLIARWWGLDPHEGEAIWGFDAGEWSHLDSGTRMSSFTPGEVLQAGTRMTASGDHRPTFRWSLGRGSLDFSGGNRKMETGDWGGVQALPMTVYMVVTSLSQATGTTSQPFWSRSGTDSGYTWGWLDRADQRVKAATSSAFSPGVPISDDLLDTPAVIAIILLPSGHARIHLNNPRGFDAGVQTPDSNMGPWMRSLKLGANASEANWSEMNVREMWWHHGANPDTVAQRIRDLATKHEIMYSPLIGDWHNSDDLSGAQPIPDWATHVDIVAVGAGGGGSGGGFFATGDGGRAGQWAHDTVALPADAETLRATRGAGGAGGDRNSNNGGSGLATRLTIGNTSTAALTAPGGGPGTSTSSNQAGRAAGEYAAFGATFTGGGSAGVGVDGREPGGGGGPGANNGWGHPGGRGKAWWRFTAH